MGRLFTVEPTPSPTQTVPPPAGETIPSGLRLLAGATGSLASLPFRTAWTLGRTVASVRKLADQPHAEAGGTRPALPFQAPRTSLNHPVTARRSVAFRARGVTYFPFLARPGTLSAPSAGLEPAHTAPEADALSAELRGRTRHDRAPRKRVPRGRCSGDAAADWRQRRRASAVAAAAASSGFGPVPIPCATVTIWASSSATATTKRPAAEVSIVRAQRHCPRSGAPGCVCQAARRRRRRRSGRGRAEPARWSARRRPGDAPPARRTSGSVRIATTSAAPTPDVTDDCDGADSNVSLRTLDHDGVIDVGLGEPQDVARQVPAGLGRADLGRARPRGSGRWPPPPRRPGSGGQLQRVGGTGGNCFQLREAKRLATHGDCEVQVDSTVLDRRLGAPALDLREVAGGSTPRWGRRAAAGRGSGRRARPSSVRVRARRGPARGSCRPTPGRPQRSSHLAAGSPPANATPASRSRLDPAGEWPGSASRVGSRPCSTRCAIPGTAPVIRDQLLDALRAAPMSRPASPSRPKASRSTPPKQREHGDLHHQRGAPAGQGARGHASDAADAIQRSSLRLDAVAPAHVERVEIAGPGFLNFYLAPTWLHDVLRAVVAPGATGTAAATRSTAGGSTSSSCRPTRPGRSTPAAAAGSRSATRSPTCSRPQGAVVHREYYLNDAGNQLDTFAASLHRPLRGARSRPRTATRASTSSTWRARHARRARRRRHRGAGPRVGLPATRCASCATTSVGSACTSTRGSRSGPCTSAATSTSVLDDLPRRGVDLRARRRHLAAHDRLRRPARPGAGEVRRRARPTCCNDIAYHRDKFARGLGAPHRHLGRRPPRPGQVAAGRASRRSGIPQASPRSLLGQLVKLCAAASWCGISKRAGNIVTLADILDEVDPDVARLTFLLQSIDTHADLRPRRRHRAVDGEPRLLRAVRARPDRVDRAQGARSAGVTRLPDPRHVDLAPLVHERELDLLRALDGVPRSGRRGRDAAGTAPGHHLGPRLRRRGSTASTATAGSSPTTRHSPRPGSGWPRRCRIGLAVALGHPRRARARRDDAPRRRRRARTDADASDRSTLAHAAPLDAGRVGAPSSRASARSAAATSTHAGRRVRHAAVRLRRGRAARPLPRVPSTRSAPTRSRTRARRSSAWRWPGSSPRRACTSTSPPAASCTSRSHAGFPRGARRVPRQQQVGRRAARPRSTPAWGASSPTPSTSSTASRRSSAHATLRTVVSWCGSPPASRPTPTSTSRPAPTTRSSASRCRHGVAREAVARGSRESARCVRRAPLPHRSQILVSSRSRRAIAVVAELAAEVGRGSTGRADRRAQPGRRPRRAATSPTTDAPTIAEYAACAARQLRGRVRRAAVSTRAAAHGRARAFDRRPRRASRSTASARSRRSPASRTYVAVDGGMSDNPRPGPLRRRLRGLPARPRVERAAAAAWPRSSGKHCEQGDVLVARRAPPRRRRRRRLLATPVTGAYGYSMASNYNMVPRPAVVFVRDGEARVVVRRETHDDLVRARPVELRETDRHGRPRPRRDARAAATSARALVRLIARPRRRDRGAAPACRSRSRGSRCATSRKRARRAAPGRAASPTTPQSVVADPDVDVVVEVIGGIEPARALIIEALRAASRSSPPTRSCSPRTAASCSRPPRARASTCSSRRRSPAASR